MTFDRTSLEERSTRRRDLNSHNRQTDRHPCPPKGFEPANPASERPKIHALDRATTGTGAERTRVVNCGSLNCCLIVSVSDFFTTDYKELSSERVSLNKFCSLHLVLTHVFGYLKRRRTTCSKIPFINCCYATKIKINNGHGFCKLGNVQSRRSSAP
jgi:hypothetical protein